MSTSFAPVQRILQNATDRGDIPGAVALAGTADTRHLIASYGVRRYSTPPEQVAVTPETHYDLASLTKVTATLPAILKLATEGDLSLQDRVGRFFTHAGWFQTPSLADVTIKQLLTHSSGLPAWKPLFAITDKRLVALANVIQTEVEPVQYLYSDLGFILLGAIIERVTGLSQDEYLQREIFNALGLTELGYGPLHDKPVAATEDCGWRGLLLEGVVHDENAYALGGVAGHAGLFGTADALATYAQAWLTLDERLASHTLLREASQEQLIAADGTRRGLGWLLASPGSIAGRYASAASYGHTGFTGTSLWIDPEQGWFALLLTNRVHPSRQRGQNIQALRQAFHEAVAQAFA